MWLIDIHNLSFEDNFMVIRIGHMMKASTKKLHIGEIKFPWYQENDKICVFTCMKKYLKLTVNLRGNITRLFITTTKPYKTASQDTLATWIKTIDISIFSAHSTRSASTTRAATRIPIVNVLKTGGLRSMRTFAKHYNKDVIVNNILN